MSTLSTAAAGERGQPISAPSSLRAGLLRAWLPLTITAFVLLVALLGPLLAPRDPLAFVGPIYGAPEPGFPLGFDHMGRDVLSRLLHGGSQLVAMSVAAALLAWLLGTALGLVAGYTARWLDQALIWASDSFHAFPNVIFVLLVVSMLGRSRALIVLTAALTLVPGVLRLARGLTLHVASHEFVEAAAMLGHTRWRIRLREILPNVITPLLVHLGTMLSWAVTILSGLSFLGYGVSPPTADWGLMINENRAGLPIQPWAVLAPVVMTALLALGTNTTAESFSRTLREREHA